MARAKIYIWTTGTLRSTESSPFHSQARRVVSDYIFALCLSCHARGSLRKASTSASVTAAKEP